MLVYALTRDQAHNQEAWYIRRTLGATELPGQGLAQRFQMCLDGSLSGSASEVAMGKLFNSVWLSFMICKVGIM